MFVLDSAWATKPIDWGHPRGPHLNGVIEESALADEWPAQGPPVLWRRTLGQGYSGFAIVDGRFYTQFQNSAGQYVACFELDTSREIWRTRYGLPWQLDGEWPGPYATPVYAEGNIYFAGCFAKVGCVRADNGKLLWSVDLQKRFAGEGTEFGYGCVPLVDDGKVYLPVGGKEASVVALDAKSGALIWKSGSDPASYCGSLAITVEGHRQIVSYLQNITVAHDPDSGAELWRHTRGHGYAEHAAWPIWSPPFLFYSEPFRQGTSVLELDYLNGSPRLQEVWQTNVLCNDIFSSVIVDGHIYGFDLLDYQAIHEGESEGHFKCIELATGIEKWAVTNTGHAMVLTDQTNLVILNELGELILAEVTPDEYRERSRAQIFKDVQCWVAPAFYDGRLLVRAKTNMACIYLGDPTAARLRELRQVPTIAPVARQPGVFDRYRSDAYFAPTLRDLNEWFWISVLGVLLPVSLSCVLFRRKVSSVAMLGGGAFIGGLLACPLYTTLFERLMFTWPVAVHAVYFAVSNACQSARRNDSQHARWIARASLAGLIGVCLLYHALCRHHFIVMGWGFLIGILPALPVTLLSQQAISASAENTSPGPLIASWSISFVVFYWSAALFIHWRT